MQKNLDEVFWGNFFLVGITHSKFSVRLSGFGFLEVSGNRYSIRVVTSSKILHFCRIWKKLKIS